MKPILSVINISIKSMSLFTECVKRVSIQGHSVSPSLFSSPLPFVVHNTHSMWKVYKITKIKKLTSKNNNILVYFIHYNIFFSPLFLSMHSFIKKSITMNWNHTFIAEFLIEHCIMYIFSKG